MSKPDVEYTIGVCVEMTWDEVAKRYVATRMTTTDGGLFSDACEGAWVPGLGEWIKNEYDFQVTAHQDAQAVVALNIGEMDP